MIGKGRIGGRFGKWRLVSVGEVEVSKGKRNVDASKRAGKRGEKRRR